MARDPGAAEPALNIFVGWVFIVAALPVAWYTGSRTLEKLQAPSWPVVIGEVVASDMYQQTGKSHDWCLKMSYHYRAGGVDYRGKRIGVSMLGSAGCHRERDVTARRLARWRAGSAIAVRYDPADPARAALVTEGVDVMDYFLAFLAAMLAGGGILAVRDGRRQKLLPEWAGLY